jgi:hypothetical protein
MSARCAPAAPRLRCVTYRRICASSTTYTAGVPSTRRERPLHLPLGVRLVAAAASLYAGVVFIYGLGAGYVPLHIPTPINIVVSGGLLVALLVGLFLLSCLTPVRRTKATPVR